MLNPSLTRRINALPDTLSRLMSDPAVSESMARADESKRRLTRLLPLDGVEQSAIDEYRRDWLARYVYNSNAIEGSTLSLKDTELVMEGEFVPTDSPARYIFAARGVADGMAYVEWFVDRRHPLDIDVIRKLHEITAVFRCSYTLSSVWVCCFGLVVECIHWMARCSSSGRSRAPRSISLMRLEGTQSASPICCWVMFRLTRSSRSLAPRSAGVPRPTSPLRMLMSARYASRAMNRLTQRMISSLPLPSRVFLAM